MEEEASPRPSKGVPSVGSLPRVFVDINTDDDFCCTICTELLLRPVTLSCGHTVCLHCLKTWLEHQGPGPKVCPQCRQVMNLTAAEDCAVNIQMEAIVSRCFPERFTQRTLEYAETLQILNRERRERLQAEALRSSLEEEERDRLRLSQGELGGGRGERAGVMPPSPGLRARRERHRASQNGVFPLTVLLTRAIASCVTKTVTAPLERQIRAVTRMNHNAPSDFCGFCEPSVDSSSIQPEPSVSL